MNAYTGKKDDFLDDIFLRRLHQILDPISVPFIMVNKEAEIIMINEDFS